MLKQTIAIFALACGLASQTPAQDKAPATPKVTPKATPAAPKRAVAPASRVDTVIEMVKAGMSEAMVIKALQRENKPIDLGAAEMLKLQKAGVSENIMNAMLDPGAAAKPAVVPTSASAAPVPVTPAPAAAPKADNPPAITGPATPFPAALAGTPTGPHKRRLAVDPFDYSAVKNWVTFWFNSDFNVGQGIRSMLTTRMYQSKNITLLEREKLQKIMTEQDVGGTNRFNQGTKAKLGKLVGADALLFGDIVIFGRDDKAKKTGFGSVIPRGLGGFGVFTKEEKAVVAINLRIVDSETGELIETGEARGESSRKSKDWSALAGAWNKGGAAATSGMNSSNFEETIIGEATSDAVNKIVLWLDQKIPQMAAKARSIEGRVANIDGNQMILTVGENDGVMAGDRFEIDQITDVVIDPETKQEKDKVTVKVGEFVVHNVRPGIATGEYGGQPVSAAYAKGKGYAARLMAQ